MDGFGDEEVGGQVELIEEYDPNYEPTEEDIQEYAAVLGMDFNKHPDLKWIAIEGLKAPLPECWKPCEDTTSGEMYYFNFETGASLWDHPCDEEFRQRYEDEVAKRSKYIKKKNQPAPSSGDGPAPAAAAARPKTAGKRPVEQPKPRPATAGSTLFSSNNGATVLDAAELLSLDDDLNTDRPQFTGDMLADLDDSLTEDSPSPSADEDLAAMRASLKTSHGRGGREGGMFGGAARQAAQDKDKADLEQKLEAERAAWTSDLKRRDQAARDAIEQTMRQELDAFKTTFAEQNAASKQDLQAQQRAANQLSRDKRQLEEDNTQLLAKFREELQAKLKVNRSELEAQHEKNVAAVKADLDKDMEELKASLAGNKARLEKEKAESKTKIERELEAHATKTRGELETAHRATMGRLRQELEAAQQKERGGLEGSIADAKRKAEQQVSEDISTKRKALEQQLEQEMSAKTAKVKQAHAEETAELNKAHRRTVEQLERTHRDQLEDAKRKHQRELENKQQQIRQEGEAALSDLHREIQGLHDQCSDEQRELETFLRNLQDKRKTQEGDLKREVERKAKEAKAELAELAAEIDGQKQELERVTDDVVTARQQLLDVQDDAALRLKAKQDMEDSAEEQRATKSRLLVEIRHLEEKRDALGKGLAAAPGGGGGGQAELEAHRAGLTTDLEQLKRDEVEKFNRAAAELKRKHALQLHDYQQSLQQAGGAAAEGGPDTPTLSVDDLSHPDAEGDEAVGRAAPTGLPQAGGTTADDILRDVQNFLAGGGGGAASLDHGSGVGALPPRRPKVAVDEVPIDSRRRRRMLDDLAAVVDHDLDPAFAHGRETDRTLQQIDAELDTILLRLDRPAPPMMHERSRRPARGFDLGKPPSYFQSSMQSRTAHRGAAPTSAGPSAATDPWLEHRQWLQRFRTEVHDGQQLGRRRMKPSRPFRKSVRLGLDDAGEVRLYGARL